MALGFRWKMGDYVGGDKYVHQAYKPWLALDPDDWAIGEFQVQPRDTSNRVFTGLGFEPNVLFLISYRPQNANGTSDNAFGARGGGMSYGVAGGCPSISQWSGSTKIRHAFESKHSGWREDCALHVLHKNGVEVLRLVLDSFDADGFTLQQAINLYDQTDYVAWLAMKGRFKVGVMDANTTQIDGIPGTPRAAVFISTKHTAAHGVLRTGVWNHMQGFATPVGEAAIWGGGRNDNWDWTTERWHDDASIFICTSASGSFFAGVTQDQVARIAAWTAAESTVTITRSGTTAIVAHTAHGFSSGQCLEISGADQSSYNGAFEITVTGLDEYTYTLPGTPTTPATGDIKATIGSVDIQWDEYDGQPYRIGYVLSGDFSDSGIIETNWETRQGGSQNDFSDNSNWVPTTIRPRVVLMMATNYNFVTGDNDPFNAPREALEWWKGGSGGLGWHAQPFSDAGNDAYGVHTFGNAVAELGRYANSGTQYLRRYILAGQGANSQPPAYHQHSINIIPNPRQPGLNWRYSDRHLTSARLLHDE